VTQERETNRIGQSQREGPKTKVKGRTYNYGDVKLNIVKELMRLKPDIVDEPLYLINRPSRVGRLLLDLHRKRFASLIKENKIGGYIEDQEIPAEFREFTYDPSLCFPKETIQTFKYSQEWLKEKIIEILPFEWRSGKGGFTNAYSDTFNSVENNESINNNLSTERSSRTAFKAQKEESNFKDSDESPKELLLIQRHIVLKGKIQWQIWDWELLLLDIV